MVAGPAELPSPQCPLPPYSESGSCRQGDLSVCEGDLRVERFLLRTALQMRSPCLPLEEKWHFYHETENPITGFTLSSFYFTISEY